MTSTRGCRRPRGRCARALAFAAGLLFLGASARAATFNGDPSNYLSFLSSLQPGDTLLLAAGTYTSGLPISNKNGLPASPLVIEGPAMGPRAVFRARACCNTVSIVNSAHVIVRNLELDGLGMPGIDAVKAEGGDANYAHDITLENLFIHGHDGDQQTVGISTKCPAWNWIIRGNVIATAGTGMYLGDSDGSSPFVNGLIEGNLVLDTIGYNAQIKHQNARLAGMPASGTTIIRHNVFGKANNAATGPNARPNLLVGHWPLAGPGSSDVYQIYGNFFWANPTGEALFQGEGNIALYDNLFVNQLGPAVWIQPHNDLPRAVSVFNNTVLAQTTGIRVTGGEIGYVQQVVGNASFAGTPVSVGGGATQSNNVTDTYDNADVYVVSPFGNPSGVPSALNLFPLAGTLTGPPLGLAFNAFVDWDRDFNGVLHDGTFRGAYAGEGSNPGWLPKLERKPPWIAIEDMAAMEGNSGTALAGFPVRLSMPSTQTVTVNYVTADGSAMAPSDYSTTSGTVTFPPGSTLQAANVPVVGDTLEEPNESFAASLSAPGNATIARGGATGTILDDEATDLFTLTPCRLADTRDPVGPSGGPSLSASSTRSFPVAGACGVPTDAKAVVLNVTAVDESDVGNLRLYPAGVPVPLASTINFVAGRTRANNTIIPLGMNGQIGVKCDMPAGPAGSTHFVMDAYGYMR